MSSRADSVTTPLLIHEGETDTDTQIGEKDSERDAADQSLITDSWKWYHTIAILCIRLIVDFVFKNPLVFYLDYEQGLQITYLQFAYILIAAECGCIFAIFIGDINKKYIGSELRIMEIYLVICGIAQISTPLFTYLDINQAYTIIWCCLVRFIVGISFAFISAASIKFASEYVSHPSKITSIISILHYSWPLSTVLNIFAGYLILYSWMFVFIASGVLLILISIFSVLMFRCLPVQMFENERISYEEINNEQTLSEMDQQNGLRILFTDFNSLLIVFVSFFMTFRSRTIYIVTSSLWMEGTYGLSSAMLGWCTLSVIIGEIFGLSIMSTISHKFPLWISALATLIHQFIFGALLLLLAVIYGDNMALSVALILIMFLTMGHESFYVVQQSNAIHYAPLPRLKFLLLLGERMAQESASIMALFATVWVWKEFSSNSIVVFSIIWIVATLIESCILLIYTSEPTLKQTGR